MEREAKALRQNPEPGRYVLFHRGDLLEFSLAGHAGRKGCGFLRTNIGNANVRRSEIIRHVEEEEAILAHDWHDIPMREIDAGKYSVTLPLLEVGRFESKSFFLPEGSDEPVWPKGDNTVIKVEPAEYGCLNSVYTAFVRQFGLNRIQWAASSERQICELEKDGYSVIPRSGTFRDFIQELDLIIGTLHCRIIQLLPIHPIPTTYARMGRFGSPFAVLDFMDIDPALTEFDRRATPLEQFEELVDAVHRRSGKLFIDIPINHTGWASKLQIEHPEWFARDHDMTFKSPGAWGVTWEDLAKLDYRHRDLWKYMADVFLFWCERGMDGFRCDAGYMISYPVWEYIVAKVRLQYPDTLFMLEGLGGSTETLKDLLAGANLDWAYSELFQNYDRRQIESYLPGAVEISSTKGLLVHFAETHDNNRLASISQAYARMRTALAALCSQEGAFGITNGVEWFADDKIDVHGAPPLKWGSKDNQVKHIARLNAILEIHPCFHPGAQLQLIQRGNSNTVVLYRRSADGNESLLIIANLDHDKTNEALWPRNEGPDGTDLVDLITGERVMVQVKQDQIQCFLEPGQVLCLSSEASDLDRISKALERPIGVPARIGEQCLKAKALEIHRFYHCEADVSEIDLTDLKDRLLEDPRAFCAAMSGHDLPTVVTWTWPKDLKRVVMIPPGHFLYVRSEHPFVVKLRNGRQVLRYERSVAQNGGMEFALIRPLEPSEPHVCSLDFTVHESEQTRHVRAEVLCLSSDKEATVQMSFTKAEVLKRNCYALCTNGCEGMAQVRGVWGDIKSQYDALLAANLHPEHPMDRHIMLTRCRTWLVCRGYSQTIDGDSLVTFSIDENGDVTWQFFVPAGQGKTVPLSIRLSMQENQNAIVIDFCRGRAAPDSDNLGDDIPVRLIIRPDIEDRVSHEKTKAYTGPEKSWPGAVSVQETGFSFAPSRDRRLEVSLSGGVYTAEPEWTYMMAHPVELERGLDDSSDLFSPGYFTVSLKGGENRILKAYGGTEETVSVIETPSGTKTKAQETVDIPLDQALLKAMRQFVVKRGDSKTVIAGYPWFLDWGRDTLICLRGMIAAAMLDEANDILKQVGRFEKQGTLPNMIHGNDDSNRDTSDAPLWFFVACRDLTNAERGARNSELLDEDCGGRSLRDVLISIADHYINGTPNGIKMDPESGLVFSPAHFTWMDTNHPIGTPREGYPIEIQALWHFALRFMTELEPGGKWQKMAAQVKTSIVKYFVRQHVEENPAIRTPQQRGEFRTCPALRESAFLSDCLHAKSGQPAKQAVHDDHLRPNQLLAITLGAIEDRALRCSVVKSCEELVVPGAIRSLADRQVEFRLSIKHRGVLLNDPVRPYWGRYQGEEDARRKPAYHNGTAWTWLFPSYCEALLLTYGEQAKDTIRSVLLSSEEVMNKDCVGQVPEILDGDSPHTARGCGAQAWGVTELFRVLAILTKK